MSEKLMIWLRIATRLVLVQVMLVALSLLGLVLVGAAPAVTAAARVLDPVRRDENLPLITTMWKTWRVSLVRSNLAAALPGLLAMAAGGNLLLLEGGLLGPSESAAATGPTGTSPLGGILAAASVLVLLMSSLSWLIAVTLVADPELTPFAALRAAVLFPLVWPGTSLSMLATLGAALLVGAMVPVIAVLWGGVGIVLIVELLVSTRRSIPDSRLHAS